MAVARYAIYAAPARAHPLWAMAAGWLGRDAESGAETIGPLPDRLTPASWQTIVAEPRRYGFHGTLKPPFALASGTTLHDLSNRLAAFAAAATPVPPVALDMAALGPFLALMPSRTCPALHALADRAVVEFDDFRAPAQPEELARRRAAGLTPVQEAYLQRWGYPYVLDQFRYHMTLTGALDQAERGALRSWLTAHFAAVIAMPVALELALFGAEAGNAFRLLQRHPLGRT
jgi:putative phosphonate metabolism protein